ncbi:MAG: 3-phosphoshikimate 1-carboxyvinyltransferase [Candidatus Omnitrophica bacterium]|nr:3-phosphoshikimate 1-carboxyvinyltransferase [Candidatus Omnitrophota bacterium]
MRPFVFKSSLGLKGKIILTGDKSIAHRAVILSAVSRGSTQIKNFPANKDCLATINSLKKLGVKIKPGSQNTITVFGEGLHGLNKPESDIFIAESGTTLRLLLGILAGQDFRTRVTAGQALSKRPMLRVTAPLRMMGVKIKSKLKSKEEYPPITIQGGDLRAVTYKMPVASAQVKSAILLAGLYAKGATKVIELVKTRDHTERMLKLFKAGIKPKGNTIVIEGGKRLSTPGLIYIPGDISSAAFFIVGATIIAGSRVCLKNISINPSRLGVIRVLKRMGADIQVRCHRPDAGGYEPIGEIKVKSSLLKGTVVKKAEIPSLIDELPVLMVASCFAKGRTIFEGVGELRVKETDRIRSVLENLKKMGADIAVDKSARAENIIVKGPVQLKGARLRSFGDHRTAMSMIIAGLAAGGRTEIDDTFCINKSFPEFLSILRSLTK